MAIAPPPELAGDRMRFVERARFPWWPLLAIAGFLWLVVLVIVFATDPDTASIVFGVVAAAVISVLFVGGFQLGARRLGVFVGERQAQFARSAPIPVAAIREVELVEGRRRIKRLKEELAREAGMHVGSAAGNPGIKGIMVPPGSDQAVLVRVDPEASNTPVFLLASKRPQELRDTLRDVAGLG
jgi:hypothetical protein